MDITVTGIMELGGEIDRISPKMIISITDPGCGIFVEAELQETDAKVLRLSFHDIDILRAGITAPSLDDMVLIRTFLRENRQSAEDTLIVHCHAGMSRSPMVALYVMVHEAVDIERLPQSEEVAKMIVARLGSLVRHLMPNERIRRIIVRDFGEFGRMIDDELTNLLLARKRREAPVDPNNIW